MNSGPRKRAVFISYAHTDMDFARILSESLRAKNIDVLDDRSVAVGASFASVLRDEIARADSVVVLMSPAYFSSKWCQAELATAMAEEKQVLPVRLRGETEGPLTFLVYIDGDVGPGAIASKITDVLEATP